MTRRQWLTQAASAGVYFHRASSPLFAAPATTYSRRAMELVERSIVVDMLGLLTFDWNRLQSWQEVPEAFTAKDRKALLAASVNVIHPAVKLNTPDIRKSSIQLMKNWSKLAQNHPETFLQVNGASDFQLARDGNRIGLLCGMQNSDHFADLEDVRYFHALGQRISQLSYNYGNRVAGGCRGADNGLTAFGTGVVSAMNHCGMAIDVSHTGDRSTLEAIEASSTPVLVTHSNCRALYDHPRCKTDEAIRALAKREGVIGITALATFVGKGATIEQALDHFDHVARLVGVEHVGIGSDTDLCDSTRIAVSGLDHRFRIYDLTEGLIARGYSDSDIEGILGKNFIRALSGIWTAAAPAAPMESRLQSRRGQPL